MCGSLLSLILNHTCECFRNSTLDVRDSFNKSINAKLCKRCSFNDIIQWTSQMTLFSPLFDILDAYPINGFKFASFFKCQKKEKKHSWRLHSFDQLFEMQTNMVLCAFIIIIIICTDESSKNYARNMERVTFAWYNEALKAFKVEYWKLGATTTVIIIILVLSFVRHAHIFFFSKNLVFWTIVW